MKFLSIKQLYTLYLYLGNVFMNIRNVSGLTTNYPTGIKYANSPACVNCKYFIPDKDPLTPLDI
jgi:hypothetical protein